MGSFLRDPSRLPHEGAARHWRGSCLFSLSRRRCESACEVHGERVRSARRRRASSRPAEGGPMWEIENPRVLCQSHTTGSSRSTDDGETNSLRDEFVLWVEMFVTCFVTRAVGRRGWAGAGKASANFDSGGSALAFAGRCRRSRRHCIPAGANPSSGKWGGSALPPARRSSRRRAARYPHKKRPIQVTLPAL